MSSTPHKDASFIVRIWWEQRGGRRVAWRGRVIHAQTHQSAYFEGIPALVAFLEQWTGSLSTEERASKKRKEEANVWKEPTSDSS